MPAVSVLASLAKDLTVSAIKDRLPVALTAAGRFPSAVFNERLASSPLAFGIGASQPVAIPDSASSVSIFATTGSLSNATATIQVSPDGGTTWTALVGTTISSAGGLVTGTATASPIASNTVGSSIFLWEAGLPVLPAGSLLRINGGGTTITAGAAVVTFSAAPVESVVAVGPLPASAASIGSVALNPSSNSVGFVRTPGMWHDLTGTPLGAGGTFTGSTFDFLGVAASAGWNSSSLTTGIGNGTLRARSVSDQAGTLCYEESRDGGVTWQRVQSVSANNNGTDQVGAGVNYVATLEIKPTTRHGRLVYVNGGTAQGRFYLNDYLIAA